MSGAVDEKKALRAELRLRLRAIDLADRKERSAAAAERLVSTEEFRAARTLMVFLPLGDEIDPRAVAERAWREGKAVSVPHVIDEEKRLVPLALRQWEEPMDTDRLGVRTPRDGAPRPIGSIDLVVVPGLGFDRRGGRIGRGAGFYDRLLASPAFRGISCGLAMREQVVESVPHEGHDVRLNMLVTDEWVLRPDRGGGRFGLL